MEITGQLLDRRKLERELKILFSLAKEKSVSKIEGRIASKASGINSNWQFESSLPRQTAKSRLCTAILVARRSRDKLVDDAWNWSTRLSILPLSFFSLSPSAGQISRTRRFLFLDRRESNHFSFQGKSSSKKGLLFLGEYEFSIVSFSEHDRCVDAKSYVDGSVQDRKLNLNRRNY